MKHSLAFTSLVWAGALVLGCGADDSDPPPVVAAPAATPAPGTPAPGATPGAPTTTPTESTPTTGTTPTSTEGQGGASFNGGVGMEAPAGGAAPPAMGAAGTAPADMGAAGTGEVPPPPAPTELSLQELVGPLDGHLFVVPCGDTPAQDDCNGAGWTSTFLDPGVNHTCATTGAGTGRLEARIDFPIGGEAGVAYDVDFHFYGIMEPRQYANVTRDAAPGRPTLQPSAATAFATLNPGATNYLAGDNNYNTYELRVLNPAGQEVAAYFLNADTQDGHYTLGIDYQKTLQVIGGGTLRLQIVDANCRQIKNCGPGSGGGVACAQQVRTIDISGADPAPALQQPAFGGDPAHAGQWFLIDVLDFAAAQ